MGREDAARRSGPRRPARPAVEEIGSIAEKLAVLISAGVSPVSAWQLVAASEGRVGVGVGSDVEVRGGVAGAVAERTGRGMPVADAIVASAAGAGEHAAWSMLATAWFVATEAGASLARCLVDIAAALRDLGRVEREVAAVLSGPRATTRLVLVLPFVSLGSGLLLGLDTVQVLVSTPAGWVCAGAGLTLVLIGRAWSHWLLRRGRRHDQAPGLALDLVAVAVGGGGSASGATELVSEALRRYGPRPPSGDVRGDREHRQIAAVLSLAALAGAPPAELLRAEAVRLRRDAIGAASERAAALGVQLMLPLGLCVLPAFLLLSVAPVLLGVLRSTSIVDAG